MSSSQIKQELLKRGYVFDEPDKAQSPSPNDEVNKIAQELQKQGYSFETPGQSSTGRSLARGAKNVLAGALDMADLLGSPLREGINLGAKALGSNYRMQPMGETTSQAIDKATQGFTKSETPRHRTEEAIQRGLSSMIPGVGAGNILSKGVGMASKALGRSLKASSAPTASNIAGTTATTGLMQNYLIIILMILLVLLVQG